MTSCAPAAGPTTGTAHLEDDIVIHDPGFFDKLAWFQAAFGPKAVLQPTVYELSRTGVPAKVVIAPRLNEFYGRPFRREGQAKRLRQRWLGREVAFEIPDNPHSPSFFLSAAQMDMLVQHPSYGDRDFSWIDPMVSAATLAIGKVFDLYKAVDPARFFLEAEHYGVRYSGRFAPFDVRYGDEPMLAIAEAALRSLAAADHAPDAIAQLLELACSVGGSVSRQAVEERALGVISAHRDGICRRTRPRPHRTRGGAYRPRSVGALAPPPCPGARSRAGAPLPAVKPVRTGSSRGPGLSG